MFVNNIEPVTVVRLAIR